MKKDKGKRMKDKGRDRGGGTLVFVIRDRGSWGRSAVFVVGERPWARRKTNLLVEGRKAVHVYRLLPWARS